MQACANDQTSVIKDQTVQIDELLAENQRLLNMIVKHSVTRAEHQTRKTISVQTDPVLLSEIAEKHESFRPELNVSSFQEMESNLARSFQPTMVQSESPLNRVKYTGMAVRKGVMPKARSRVVSPPAESE
jgi:hypothetical protein